MPFNQHLANDRILRELPHNFNPQPKHEMKSKTAKLSRAEVNRRIPKLSVDPWRNLSGFIAGCLVNAWASGCRKRVERISVCAIPKMGGNLATCYRLAKELKRKTGLVIHWHGSNIGKGGVL